MDLAIVSFSCKILGNVFIKKVKITYLLLYIYQWQSGLVCSYHKNVVVLMCYVVRVVLSYNITQENYNILVITAYKTGLPLIYI
jgi:hypothetical protein